jgi:hypothetical protein
MSTVQDRLPMALQARLDGACRLLATTPSDVVRRAIEAFLGRLEGSDAAEPARLPWTRPPTPAGRLPSFTLGAEPLFRQPTHRGINEREPNDRR